MKKIPSFYILLLPVIYLAILGFNYSQEKSTGLELKKYSGLVKSAQESRVTNFTDTLIEPSGDTVLIHIERHSSQPEDLNVKITR
jgi:hypothetical protein